MEEGKALPYHTELQLYVRRNDENRKPPFEKQHRNNCFLKKSPVGGRYSMIINRIFTQSQRISLQDTYYKGK